MHRHIRKRKELLEFLCISLIVVLAFSIYEVKQFETPLLYGIDGPYYYVQIHSLIERGELKYPDPPLAFYILYLFSIIFKDIILGIKIGSVLITLLTTYFVYYFVKSVGNDRVGGIIAALIFTIYPSLGRLCFDFMKNAMGLLFLMMTIFFYYRSCKTERLKDIVLASISIILTGLTHILDFAVAYGMVIFLVLLYIAKGRVPKKLALPLIIGTILLALGFIYEPIMGGDPYKGISYLLSLVHSETTKIEIKQVRMPMRNPIHIGHRIGSLMIMVGLPLVIGVIGIIFAIKCLNGVERSFIFVLSFILTILCLPINPIQFLMRFSLMSAILIPPILGTIIGRVVDKSLKIIIGMMIIAFIIPQFIAQMNSIRPSITIEEYHEIARLVLNVPKYATFIVPDTKLRYWIETFDVNALKSPMEGGRPPYILVVENDIFRRIPMPPGSKLIFYGRYIRAYVIQVRPIRR